MTGLCDPHPPRMKKGDGRVGAIPVCGLPSAVGEPG